MNDAAFSYSGYEIPIDLMNLTGGGPDTFGAISDQHIEHLRKHVGLYANQRIVEIGCGIGRDAIPLTRILGTEGHYIGIDVTKPSIEGAQQIYPAGFRTLSSVISTLSIPFTIHQAKCPLVITRSLSEIGLWI
jgi:SAM-dependent methyltransferase